MLLKQRRYPADDYSRFVYRGLVAHWTLLDVGNIYDKGGYAITPMVKGPAALGSDFIGYGSVFDGVGGSSELGLGITAGVSPAHIGFSTESFSVALYAKYGTGSFTSGSYPYLIGKKRHNSTQGWGIGISQTAGDVGEPYLEVGDGVDNFQVVSGIACNDAKWHLIVAVVDRENSRLGISIDAKPFVYSGSIAALGDISTQGVGLAGFNLGSRNDSVGQFRNKYIGRMREVKLWKRILSDTDVKFLYQEKEFFRDPPYSLVDYDFTGSSGFNRVISINT